MRTDGIRMVSILAILALMCAGMVCIMTNDDSSAADTDIATHTYYVGDSVNFEVNGAVNGSGYNIWAFDTTTTYVPGCSFSVGSDGPQGPPILSGTATKAGYYLIKTKTDSVVTDIVWVIEKTTFTSSQSSPMTSFARDSVDDVISPGTYTIYVKVGSSFKISSYAQTGHYKVWSASGYSSYGLSKDTNSNLTGTISKAGSLTVNMTYAWVYSSAVRIDLTSVLNFVFVEDTPSYTVSFSNNYGSTSPSSQTVKSGTSISLPSAGTRTGYTFAGWYTSSSGGTYKGGYGSSYTVTSTTTLYAQWNISSYTVSFSNNYGSTSPASKSANYGSYIYLPDPGTRTGYTFSGWYTSSSGGSYAGGYNSTYYPSSNVTLYAQWTVNSYTVSFSNSYGSNGGTTKTANYNSSISLPDPGTRTGYTFAGWYTSSSGGTRVGGSGSSYTVTSGTYLYAQWTINSYTITYSNSYGSNGSSSAKADYGTYVYLPDPGTRSGYEFDGWYTSSSGGTNKGGYGSSYYVESATTLYAQWKQVYTHTITYASNNGSGTMTNSVVTDYTSGGTAVTLKSNGFTRSGYEFDGWLINGTVYQPGSTYSVSGNSSVTATAQWKQVYAHTIVYSSNGGSGTMSNTVVTDYTSGTSSVTLADNAYTKDGHTFIAWLIDGVVYLPGETCPVSGGSSVTATAQWQQNEITLHELDTQYAMVNKSMSFNAGADISPSRDITYSVSNVTDGLTVTVSGSAITVSSTTAGTYTFTLTASATNYKSDSMTVTVIVDPVLKFTNSVTSGELTVKGA